MDVASSRHPLRTAAVPERWGRPSSASVRLDRDTVQ